MPFRLGEMRTKVQFVTFAAMPSLVNAAAKRSGKPSNTVYIQHAVCEALARDLGVPLNTLMEQLPPPKGKANSLKVLTARSE